MRALSFVDFVRFDGIGSNSSRNLCLYDVDGDGDNELIVGYWDSGPLKESGQADAEHSKGSLYVFKQVNLWKVNHELDMVLCVIAGCVISESKPWILALCADSHCYAFDATQLELDPNPKVRETIGPVINGAQGRYIHEASIPTHLKMVHHQQMAFNAKDACLIYSEGGCDLAVAHSDRVVRLYTWCPEHGRRDQSENNKIIKGRFVILIKWELAGQINRIDVHWTVNYGNLLIASQPGGSFTILHRKFEKHKDKIAPTLLYYPPRVANTRNLEARTWIVGSVRDGTVEQQRSGKRAHTSFVSKSSPSLMGLCMADGNVLLMDPTAEDDCSRVLWCTQLRVYGELFGFSKVDLTCNNSDELCACGWDGTTYILSRNEEVFQFPLGQSCQAFTAGLFAIRPGQNEPVFVYTTCEHNLLIYHNLNVRHVLEPSLLHTITSDKTLADKFSALGVDLKNPTQMQKAVRCLLYEFPKLHSDQIPLPVPPDPDTEPQKTD